METQLNDELAKGALATAARALVIACVMTSPVTLAREVSVLAPVVDVEPVYAAPERRCDVPPPERSNGLAARLAWDLRDRCRAVATVATAPESYRVVYEWDGRRFATLTDEPPGDTVQLYIDIE
ncbi:MAG: hypothetical protein AAF515_22840 [Pseudomonadota bacterium]